MINENVHKLNAQLYLPKQVLELAGWYEGRNVDITKREHELKKYGYTLNNKAKNILSEYYSISPMWFFRYEIENRRPKIGGLDFYFETKGEHKLGCTYERKQLPKNEQKSAVPIMTIGFHMPGTLWITDSGHLYHTVDYRDDYIHKYETIFELLEYELKFPSNEIFVTFKNQDFLYWDN